MVREGRLVATCLCLSPPSFTPQLQIDERGCGLAAHHSCQGYHEQPVWLQNPALLQVGPQQSTKAPLSILKTPRAEFANISCGMRTAFARQNRETRCSYRPIWYWPGPSQVPAPTSALRTLFDDHGSAQVSRSKHQIARRFSSNSLLREAMRGSARVDELVLKHTPYQSTSTHVRAPENGNLVACANILPRLG